MHAKIQDKKEEETFLRDWHVTTNAYGVRFQLFPKGVLIRIVGIVVISHLAT